MAEPDLEALKAEITALGEKVKQLKSTPDSDKDAVAAAVKALLDAKKRYAELNNGVGVDGKPFVEQLSKSDKKKAAKEQKAAAAIAAVGASDAKQSVEGDNSGGGDGEKSLNSQKKASKKALKAEKKAAHKEQGTATPTTTTAPPPAAPATTNTTTAASKAPATTPTVSTNPVVTNAAALIGTSSSIPLPHHIHINPNVPLTERPVVALTVAVLTNTILDYTLISDHKSRHSSLGLPNGGGVVVGDFAMARYILRRAQQQNGKTHFLSGGSNNHESEQTLVDAWMDYAQSLMKLDMDRRFRAVTMTLDASLQQHRTFLVGSTMTLADISVFCALGFPTQSTDRSNVLNRISSSSSSPSSAYRWISMMAVSPAVQEATQLALGVAQNYEAVFDPGCVMEPLVSGMNPLEGAIPGRVVTRFPPEPSGYLHIGHAKAVLLNDYYARRYFGRLIVRFDDTNPSKEKEEYQESIVQDLARLGVKPDVVTYTSDYFEVIQKYAEYMIQHGLAYMDNTPQEQMKAERAERIESKHRNQTPEEALQYFRLMCSGSKEGADWCLRAKMDMKSDNGTMRDPVFYRQNLTPHHRWETKFKAYPTYDMACPIVDSMEGVTHALRTTEYNDRDEQYQWVLQALGLRRVRIHAFARLNFVNTVLSKRKLTWFVENNYVTGWDDARFPTIRGVVRRGINITALRHFVYSQGASRRVVNMEWNKFWAENKKEIDKTAKRFMAIDKVQHVELLVTNAPQPNDHAFITTDYHPKDPSCGKRVVRIANKVFLESVDVEGVVVDEEIVLLRWGVIKITKVDVGLEGVYVPGGDVKAAKRKLSWLADVPSNPLVVLTEFDNLITKDKLEEDDNLEDYINPLTMATSEVIGDAGLKTLREHEIIQLERRGYYRVDRPYINSTKPLILYMIPDGKTKPMAGLEGRLAHR